MATWMYSQMGAPNIDRSGFCCGCCESCNEDVTVVYRCFINDKGSGEKAAAALCRLLNGNVTNQRGMKESEKKRVMIITLARSRLSLLQQS